jgi:hypothetical protein
MGEFVETTAPTCTSEGVKTSTCKNGCGKTETQPIETVSHVMGEWVDIGNNTQKRECEHCDYYETKPLIPDDNVDEEGWTQGTK